VSISASPSVSPESTRLCDFIREPAPTSSAPVSLSPPSSPPSPEALVDASLAAAAASTPSVKDIRRFVKRSSQLDEIVWGGRCGVGAWHLRRCKGTVKIEMTPISQLVAVGKKSGDSGCPRQRMAFSGLPPNAEVGLERERPTPPPVSSRASSPSSFSSVLSGSIGLGLRGVPPLVSPTLQPHDISFDEGFPCLQKTTPPTLTKPLKPSGKNPWPSVAQTDDERRTLSPLPVIRISAATPRIGDTSPSSLSLQRVRSTSPGKSKKAPHRVQQQSSSSATSSAPVRTHIPGWGHPKRGGKKQNQSSEAAGGNRDGVAKAKRR
jgi:hypothetical protein